MSERRAWTAAFLVMLALAWGTAGQPRERLVVGSKNFTESRVLTEVIAQLLEAETGLEVERRTNLGGTLIVHEALTAGEIDLYPEYTGTAWSAVLGHEEALKDPLRIYLEVRRAYAERFDVVWLDPFGFNNSYALAVREELAEELGLVRVSDLAGPAERLRFGMSHEFLNRPDGFPGLAAAYGLEVGELRGMEHGLAYQAIANGRIDVTDAYTTDGQLLRYPLRLLEDDRRFFPPYDAAPIVRAEVLERRPEVGKALARLAYRLSDERMQRLNHEVEVEERSFADVARGFLREEGLLADDASPDDDTSRGQGFFAFFVGRLPATGELVVEHLFLTAAAVALAILFAVPLGIVLTRREGLAAPVLGAAGVIQTIPSLALLAFMIPIPGLGLGARSAVMALFLYALLPIVRNTYTGIKGVDPDVVEAALGMGLTDGQVLRLVELPLAVRTIMAGIRTSAVISVGVATLAAFIGAGGLGEPIMTGLTLNDTRLILAGAIPAAFLALLVDFLLGLVDRALAPAG